MKHRKSGKSSALCCVVAGLAMIAGGLIYGGKATAADKKPVTVALFVAIQANPVEQSLINHFEGIAKQDGAATVVVFDSNNSVPKEIANCNDAIASKRFNAFALRPVAGPPLMKCAEAAIAAGIPVVAIGNALGPDPNIATRQVPGLSASVVQLARTNGLAVAQVTNDACAAKKAKPCKVIYTYGPLAFDWASITRKFFEEAVKSDYKNIEIIAEGANNFDPNAARILTKSLVQAHPDVDVIANDGDLGAMGVVAGLKDLGKKPGTDIFVTGGALNGQGKAMIESGEMYGSTCLMPATEAETDARYTIMAARHEAIAQPDVEVCRVFAKTGVGPITAANIGQFTPEW
jgi:ABC-type sugar transport system substrate-binding protein